MDTTKDQTKAAAASGENINIDIRSNPSQDALPDNSMVPDEAPRTGLTKDELMKYANMPFWVRLRNTLFAVFWIVWVSILVAAIGYVVRSPGCKLVSAASTGNSTLSGPTTPAP